MSQEDLRFLKGKLKIDTYDFITDVIALIKDGGLTIQEAFDHLERHFLKDDVEEQKLLQQTKDYINSLEL